VIWFVKYNPTIISATKILITRSVIPMFFFIIFFLKVKRL
jgi:hypothetical protein